MYDWILHRLADQLGVAPPQPGEGDLLPTSGWSSPWPRVAPRFHGRGKHRPDLLALSNYEGKASTASKVSLAAIRIALVLLAMFMLSEAVLSVERTGLPYLAILIDDSESQGIVDQYDKPEVKSALDVLAAPSRSEPKGKATAPPPVDNSTTRLDIAKGLILKDQARLLHDLEKQHKVRLYLVASATRPLAKVDRPVDIPAAVDLVRADQAAGQLSHGSATEFARC